MTEKEIINYVSDEYKVDFNDIVPFYNFNRDNFALYYASILNSIFDSKAEAKVHNIRIMNTGINGTYIINLNNDFNHTIAITGFDSLEQVLDNVSYMKDCLLGTALENYKPAFIPQIQVNESGIRMNNYMCLVHDEYEILKEDLYDSPIGNISIDIQNEKEIEY